MSVKLSEQTELKPPPTGGEILSNFWKKQKSNFRQKQTEGLQCAFE